MTTPAPTSGTSHRPRRRRGRARAALRHFIHGLSYGTGLTTAGLLGYWIQQML
ncbi:hypothetical protein ACIGW4_36915 [Streptomyces sp. NPDC053513]|uniref:hypothetical protein n=1 Tax=unclassified Streptomyces TaxID=2593676 RepID=UPI0037D33416